MLSLLIISGKNTYLGEKSYKNVLQQFLTLTHLKGKVQLYWIEFIRPVSWKSSKFADSLKSPTDSQPPSEESLLVHYFTYFENQFNQQVVLTDCFKQI